MYRSMETHSIFHSAINSLVVWFSHSRNGNEACKLRKSTEKRADLGSELDPHILYDIGERDCRPRPRRIPVWHGMPYHLLIEAILNGDN
jgi:hypothetical protein